MGFKMLNIDILGNIFGKGRRRAAEKSVQDVLNQAKPILQAAVALALDTLSSRLPISAASSQAQKLVNGVFQSPAVQTLAPADALALASQAASDAIETLAAATQDAVQGQQTNSVSTEAFLVHAKIVVAAAIAGAKVPVIK